jgi:aldehyde oxidoreductase
MQTITLTINGYKRTVKATPDMVLLDYLRKDLRLTGTKQSCDRKGQCGACTVIVNGKAVLSCLTKMSRLEGANVITIEGLGTPENPHLIQEAFCLTGAIQCGFCTPGMIMAAKALLDVNPNPDEATIKKALSRNLCRCTGYKKIVEAVQLAGRFIRKETTPEEEHSKIGKDAIGQSHIRPSALIKACGLALFNDDIPLPKDALEIAVVRSTEYHAKIKNIDISAAEKMDGVVGFLFPKDIKGTNRLRQIHPDQPVLCEDLVRVLGDPIIAVVAETRELARAAVDMIKVEYETLPVQLTPEESLAPGAYVIHSHSPDNICFAQPLIKGDPDTALKNAHAVIEAEFSTQTNHQAPLEPEISSAYFEGEDLIVVGRSVNIHFHLNQLKEALGYEKMQYKEAYSGGQFGIKVAIITEAIAAAAALHFKRPVRYAPTMAESMLITTKRHAYDMKVKLAVDEKGLITAYFNDFVVNKGAYTLNGPTIPTRSLMMLTGSYNIPSIKALGRSVYTNNSFASSARGAGPPQSNFALEVIIDMMAEKLGIDPLEFRLMNTLHPGQTKATGMPVQQWEFPEICEAIKPAYERAKQEANEFNLINGDNGKIKRGVGIAAFSFGIGLAGDIAELSIEINPDNSFTIYAAVADPGEGNDSMLTQIAAERLSVPLEKILLYTRNTDKTASMGPAAASRMTFMAGNALLNAIEKMEKAMEEAGDRTYEGLLKAWKPTYFKGIYKNDIPAGLDKQTGQGNSMVSDVHNIQMAEVEVNIETGKTKVLRMTCAVDAGTILNPKNFEGQVEGGMDQGVGFALREEYILGKTNDFRSFKFPTIRDSFDVEIITRENPRENGPLGATGIGEMTMISTAPAVINAIYNACGARIFSLPAKPEKVLAALAKK